MLSNLGCPEGGCFILSGCSVLDRCFTIHWILKVTSVMAFSWNEGLNCLHGMKALIVFMFLDCSATSWNVFISFSFSSLILHWLCILDLGSSISVVKLHDKSKTSATDLPVFSQFLVIREFIFTCIITCFIFRFLLSFYRIGQSLSLRLERILPFNFVVIYFFSFPVFILLRLKDEWVAYLFPSLPVIIKWRNSSTSTSLPDILCKLF